MKSLAHLCKNFETREIKKIDSKWMITVYGIIDINITTSPCMFIYGNGKQKIGLTPILYKILTFQIEQRDRKFLFFSKSFHVCYDRCIKHKETHRSNFFDAACGSDASFKKHQHDEILKEKTVEKET